jgi:DNA repair protein RadC
MPITDWPKEDRPREKLLQFGEEKLTDAELMAIFIATGRRGRTALDIAKELLSTHGGLKKLLRLSAQELIQTPGLGVAKYAALKAAIELGKRYQEEYVPVGEVLNSSAATQKFLATRLRELPSEVFACLFLDTHLRLIRFEVLFQGTINETNIYPREIVRRGMSYNAAKVILAHNHPSGKALPSLADKNITVIIQNALRLVDIEVIDHIIVGDPDNFSFAELGML